jgi:hypothetical protein
VRIDEVVLAEQAGSTLVAGALAVSNGDGDEFLDNCEAGTLGFSIANIGNRPLTNVRVLGASPISHPAVAVTAVRFDPTDLALGEAASGEIDLRAAAMRHGDTLVLEVTYAADELGGEPERRTIEVRDVESDMTFRPEVAWSFEGGMDGWQVVQGTFGPQSLPPLGAPSAGGAPSRGYMASSSLADGVCDQVRSPRVRLTATSAVSLYAAYEIEPSSDKAYDRANLALADGSPGGRRVVAPGAGLRRYEVTGGNYSGCTSGQPGWNGIGPGWLDAQWSPADLDVTNLPAAGKDYFLEITYGTDSNTAGPGFRFDEVRAKNVLVAAPDTQNDECTP